MTTILVVEDEIHIQRLIRMLLQQNGYEVVVADSGETALAELNSGLRPSLILLDIMMPGIDGLKVLGVIKAHSELRAIPVVLLTALAQENVVLQGVKLGAKDYIRKPFHPQELVERVEKLLNLAA